MGTDSPHIVITSTQALSTCLLRQLTGSTFLSVVVLSINIFYHRFGHSMIQGLVSMMSPTSGRLQSQYLLREHYNNMEKLLERRGQGMEEIMQGLVNQPAQEMDRWLDRRGMIWNQKCCRFVTEEATNFLFKEANNDFGQDLVARSGGNKVLMGDCWL